MVIGKAGREIKAEDAMSYVAGYTLGIDYTGKRTPPPPNPSPPRPVRPPHPC